MTKWPRPLRREPKLLHTFLQKERAQKIKSLKKKKALRLIHPAKAKAKFRKSPTVLETVKAVETVLKWVGDLPQGSKGEGHHLIFPLTEAAPYGEFAKGVLHVLAPKARVTLLVTPNSEQIDTVNVNENLLAHVKKSVRPDTHVRVIDHHIYGRTALAIHKAIHGNNIRVKTFLPRWMDSEAAEKHHVRRLAPFLYQLFPYFSTPRLWKKKPLGESVHPTPVMRRRKWAITRRRLYFLGIAAAKTYQKALG